VGNTAISSTLMVAALDLNLVQLLRSAMNTPSPYNAAHAGNCTAAVSPDQAAPHTINRTACAGNAHHPAATFEPSCVLHFQTRLNAIQPQVRDRLVTPVDAKPYIEPPWKVLPWPVAARPIFSVKHCLIKAQFNRTDVSDVGRTLDLFI
jgi:hypothetical protein